MPAKNPPHRPRGPDTWPRSFRLRAEDNAMLDVIARELQRQQRPASHTDAIRWAVGELAAKLTEGRKDRG
jgi:hypothetical protein